MVNRYRMLGAQIMAVLGLGAPVAACETREPGTPSTIVTAPRPPADASAAAAAPPPADASAPVAIADAGPAPVAQKPFGPIQSPAHFSERDYICVALPKRYKQCPPIALLS